MCLHVKIYSAFIVPLFFLFFFFLKHNLNIYTATPLHPFILLSFKYYYYGFFFYHFELKSQTLLCTANTKKERTFVNWV